MNKMNKFFLMGTVALSGMMGLASCASDDAFDDNGKNPGTEAGVVKTQFAINVPKAAGTRQTGNVVQEGTGWTFRGMTNIKLLPIKTSNSNRLATSSDIAQSATDLEAITNDGQHINGDKDYKIYNDVTVEVGTNNFVLYAQAAGDNANDLQTYGLLKSELSATLANNKFYLEEIKKNTTAYDNAENDLLQIVNDLLALSSWKKACDSNDESYDGALKQAREAFVKLHAGSAVAIRLSLTKLYNIVKGYSEVAGSAATEIENLITNNFTVGADDELTYKTADANVSNFPTAFGLPEGAAVLSYSSDNDKFAYADKLGGITNTNTNAVQINHITYPASLWYFDNTTLYATKDGNFNSWPASVTDWSNATAFNGWETKVEDDTRVIALANPVNYANALLVTTVKLSTDDIKDASGVVLNPVIAPNAVLVGGQPDEANWEFLPATNGFNKTVYDNVLPDEMKVNLTNVAIKENYTLLLDNSLFDDNGVRKAKADQEKVNVAVEFINNGASFQGVNGEVQNGQKFYLIAQLDPNTTDNTDNKSIFMRDYKTTMILRVTSLANAYITIPDIRADKLKLGLAVDLDWQEGLAFDIPFE